MEETIKIYSWNVFNPIVSINIKAWKRVCGKDAIFLSMLDNKRFTSFRCTAIIEILNEWLSSNKKVIICLQEVSDVLLQEINNSFPSCSIYSTNDKSMRTTIVKGIVSVNEFITLYEDNIGLLIKTEYFDVLNVHFYWKWTKDIVTQVGNVINNKLDHKYILCGDFNKPLRDLDDFLDSFDCLTVYDVNNNKKYTGINTQTGKKEIIDHIILSSDIQNVSKIKIISKVKNYKIMYNFKKIYSLYKKNKSNIWKKYRLNKDISDHKPITVTIKII